MLSLLPVPLPKGAVVREVATQSPKPEEMPRGNGSFADFLGRFLTAGRGLADGGQEADQAAPVEEQDDSAARFEETEPADEGCGEPLLQPWPADDRPAPRLSSGPAEEAAGPAKPDRPIGERPPVAAQAAGQGGRDADTAREAGILPVKTSGTPPGTMGGNRADLQPSGRAPAAADVDVASPPGNRDAPVIAARPLAEPHHGILAQTRPGPEAGVPELSAIALPDHARLPPAPSARIAPLAGQTFALVHALGDRGDRVSGQAEADDLDISATWRHADGAIASRGVQVAAAPPSTVDTARRVAAQISDAVPRGRDGIVELTLNPVELGRVRLSLTSSDGAMAVTILAERPETLDLMRRHIDLLAQEFRDMGYASASFSFEGERDQPAPTATAEPVASAGPAPVVTESATAMNRPPAETDRVDIRL